MQCMEKNMGLFECKVYQHRLADHYFTWLNIASGNHGQFPMFNDETKYHMVGYGYMILYDHIGYINSSMLVIRLLAISKLINHC